MDKFWNITIDFLAKVNTFIPLVTVLWAGIGLIGVVLILAITGCALRKRLVPNWLMWTYFIFASIIIFAQSGNDIFTVVENIEIPFLVVLVCYVLRSVFYRRPRYTYSTRSITVREIDKTRPVKNVIEENNHTALEIEKPVLDEVKETTLELETEEAVNEEVEEVTDVEKENNEEVEKAEEVKEEVTESVEEVKETVDEQVETPVEETVVEDKVEMPTVEPIAEPVAPSIKPATTPAPTSVRPTTTGYATSSTTSSFARPSATTSSFATSRPTTTTITTSATTSSFASNRPTTTATTNSTTTARPFSSLYGSRLGNTTTTTRPTTTVSNSSATSSLNRPAGLGTANAKTPRSTDDIMAAIERLRASMKK